MDMEMRNATLAAPSFCGAAGAGPEGLCGGKSFNKVEGSEVCKDYQEIKIQEQVQHLGIGSMPRGILVLLHDDLVDSCKPGDDVRITGVPIRRWKPLMKGARADAELVLYGVAVDVAQDKGSASLAIRSVAITPAPRFPPPLCSFPPPPPSFCSSPCASDEARESFKSFWASHTDSPVSGRFASELTKFRTRMVFVLHGHSEPQTPFFRGRDSILAAIAPQLCGMHTVGKLRACSFALPLPPLHHNRKSVVIQGLVCVAPFAVVC